MAAWLEEDEMWANLTKHDSVIFHDNDFEVFVDPAGSTHMYKEFEVNARGTTWDLCISKPYANGGTENSGRTLGSKGWESRFNAATKVIGGKLNDASHPSKAWTVEIAIPIKPLLYKQSQGQRPAHGKFWRINFSRVEWRVLRQGDKYVKDPKYPAEDNWVWNPQGQIQMHLPERWGILEFSEDDPNKTSIHTDPDWPVRYVAAAVYDAQQAWASKHGGNFTANVKELEQLAPNSALNGACTQRPSVTLVRSAGKAGFQATVTSLDGKVAAKIRDDRFLVLERM